MYLFLLLLPILGSVFFSFSDIYYNLSWDLMTSLPKDFKKTVECLRHHFTNDEIDNILSSPDNMTGNRRIVLTLIGHLRHGEELFKLLDILESVKDAPHLPAVLKSIRKSELYKWYEKGGQVTKPIIVAKILCKHM